MYGQKNASPTLDLLAFQAKALFAVDSHSGNTTKNVNFKLTNIQKKAKFN